MTSAPYIISRKTHTLKIFFALLFIITSLVSCNQNDTFDTQQNFPFAIQVMPIPKYIAQGQTIELRITIEPSGTYHNNQYYIRYFQYEGQGTLRYYQEPPYLPNDQYVLPAREFRLYFTATTAVSQTFDIWIEDNFKNEQKLSFQFNNKE